jgi:cytochrome P450
MVLNAGLTGGAPRILQPLVGPLVCFPIASRIRRLRELFEPTYRERVETLRHQKDDPAHPEPQDHLQQMMRYAQKERPDEVYDLDIMTKRLLTSSFGSMHQTSIQVTNMLLNILGSDGEFNTISVLRDEVSRILTGPNGETLEWTKARVAQMIRADSVARETLRLNSFGSRAIMRKVMVDGVTSEDGVPLPRGAILSFLGHPAQTEESKFDDGLKYDPFRFSRMREAAVNAEGKPGLGSLSFVSTSPTHLPFGHGKHACPGRFLIDFELKMIVAYVLTNYDIEFPPEYRGKRPSQQWLAEAMVPPAGVKIRVRRRKGTTK